MEKTISSNARYQRAMELYEQRRNSEGISVVNNNGVSGKRDLKADNVSRSAKRIKKILLQLFISFLIYISVVGIQNSDNIFLKDTLKKAKEALSYDVELNNIYNWVKTYIDENILQKETINEAEEIIPPNEGGELLDINEPVLDASYIRVQHEESLSFFNVMLEDANYIKEKFKLQKPLNGTISSRFGERVETSVEVSPYHCGTDFAAPKNTSIKAIMEGTVTTVSLTGSYGKHIVITNNDVTVLYAHCNEITVNQRN